jgi:hypothetical protein
MIDSIELNGITARRALQWDFCNTIGLTTDKGWQWGRTARP